MLATVADILDRAHRDQVRAELPQLENAARANPQDHQAVLLFAVATMILGEVELAVSALGDLISQAPQNGALAAHYAQALVNVGHYDEALKAFEHALAVSPESDDVHVSYGMALLRLGDFGKGWEHYDHRDPMLRVPQQLKDSRKIPPRYSGGNLGGKTIYLLGEQGIGDTLMMIRYAPLLARRGGRVMVAAQKELADLLRFAAGVWRVVPLGQQTPAPIDTYVRLLSLPRIFGTTVWSIPNQVPYLKPDPARVERWRRRFAADGAAPTKHVGLLWAGNPQHRSDMRRSMHLQDFSPLSDVKNVIFYALQKGSREEEAQSPPPGMLLINLAPEIKDFSDLAAVIEALDILITVDTAPAHLAGALARPVWTLVPFVPDWRWMLDRPDSPWYPTMRLFRQPKLHDWESVMTQIRDALDQFSRVE
jgi:tetratricopeptide (TPR) repeat protein